MKTFFAALAFGLILISCNYRRDKSTTELESANLFEVVQKNILETKCLRCHQGVSSSHVDLSSYAKVMETVVPFKPLESKLYTSINSGDMPKGEAKLTDAEIRLVFQWIEQGAKESTAPQKPKPPDPIPPPAPTYAWISKQIFQKGCTECHEGKEPAGKVDLTSYQGLMASTGETKVPLIPGNAKDSGLFFQVSVDFMPPEGPPLSPDAKRAIQEWIEKGALEK